MKYGFSVDKKEIGITTMNLGQGNYKIRVKKENLEGLYEAFLEIEFAGDHILMKKDGERFVDLYIDNEFTLCRYCDECLDIIQGTYPKECIYTMCKDGTMARYR